MPTLMDGWSDIPLIGRVSSLKAWERPVLGTCFPPVQRG
jgi:hypothetical protein